MKSKSLVLAAIAVLVLGAAANAFAQTLPGNAGGEGIPGQPGTPVYVPGAPVVPFGSVSYQPTRLQVTPFLEVTEQYTSNVFFTKDNKKEDWITTVTPGLSISANEASYGVNFRGTAGYNWYANQTKEDYWSVDGMLGLRYNPNPQLTFRLSEYILRSENTVEPNYPTGQQPAQPGNLVGVNRGNSPYLRNVVEPSVDWQFSRQGNVGILYRNNILRNDDNVDYEDSTENYVRPYFNYWFNQRNNIALDFAYTVGDYNREGSVPATPDFVSYNPHARYTYRLDAQMSVFADYVYSYQDNDNPGIDFYVNNPSVGIVYAFRPTLVGAAQVGYFWMTPDRGDDFTGVTSNISITQRDRQTVYSLAFTSGYEQTQFGFENLGFNRYYGGTASVQHAVTQRFIVGGTGSARNVDYYFTDRNDWLYTADATASYQVLRWLTILARAGYTKDDSNSDANSYDEWHAFLTLRISYDIF